MARTYAQIKDEIAALQKKAEELRQTEMNGVIDRIKLAIQHYGITPEQLFDGNVMARASAGSIKYADGNGNLWSGRGPRPRWLREALAAGAKLDDLKCEPGSPE
ncbi:MAG: H-NS histone family protein, partial [Alcaligenaceae bacterium]